MIQRRDVVIGFRTHTDKLEFVGRADGQVVHQICVVVLALRRSVSFCGSANWNLANQPKKHRRGRVSRPAPYKSLNSGGRETRPLRMDDDGQSEIRWRLPHQRARWFAMTGNSMVYGCLLSLQMQLPPPGMHREGAVSFGMVTPASARRPPRPR